MWTTKVGYLFIVNTSLIVTIHYLWLGRGIFLQMKLRVCADVSKGQTDVSYKGELQTLTKLSIRHQVCPSETCCAIISYHD